MFDDFKPLLKNKNFMFLWTSQILSQLTVHVMNFLLLIIIFEKTSSTIATSLLWVVYAIPAILFGPPAAAMVDMTDRRKMLAVSNILQSAVILLYGFFHGASFYLLFAVALLYSFFNQFYVPAEFASLPSLVKKKNYPLANGLFFITQQGAIIVGFSLAGLFADNLGYTNTLFLCAGFIFLAFLSVLKLPPNKAKKKVPKKFDKALVSFFEEIMEGYRFIKDKPKVYVPFLFLMALQIITAIVVVTAPAIAEEVLGIRVNSSGLYIAAPVGVGALIGAVVVPKLLVKKWRKITSVEFFLGTVIAIAFALVYVVPMLHGTTRIIAGVFAMIGTGLSFVGVFIPLQTFLQEEVPGGLRGRVFGNFWFLVTIATIFPVLLSGIITEILGIKAMFTILGVVGIGALSYSLKYADSFIANDFKLKSDHK